jgi:hypothetical protein
MTANKKGGEQRITPSWLRKQMLTSKCSPVKIASKNRCTAQPYNDSHWTQNQS